MPRKVTKRAASEEQINKKTPARKRLKKLEECISQKQKSIKFENKINLSSPPKNEKLPESVKKVNKKNLKKNKVNLPKKVDVDVQKNVNETKSLPVNDVNMLNVEQLLALGESCKVENIFDERLSSNSNNTSDSEFSDFEEVKEAEINEPVIPKEGVNITLDVPDLLKSKRKKNKSDGEADIEGALRRQVNRIKKSIQLLMHKVHLLCWLAHLKFVNNVLNSSSLMEISISFIKSKNLYPPKYADLNYLEGILKWFHKNFELKKKNDSILIGKESNGVLNELLHDLKNKTAYSSKNFILMFIVLIRILGLKARIIMSFQVLPVKPAFSELFNIEKIKAQSQEKELQSSSSKVTIKKKNVDKKHIKMESKITLSCDKNDNSENFSQSTQNSKNTNKVKKKSLGNDNKNEQKEEKNESSLKNIELLKTEIQSDSDKDLESEHFKPSISTKNKKKRKETEPNKNFRKEMRKNIMNKKTKAKLNENKGNKVENMSELSDDSDSDFTIASLGKNLKKKSDRTSSSSLEDSSNKKEGSDIWTEVYLEDEEKWISVDVPKQKVFCVNELYSRATHPVLYVIACNNDGSLKDVTKRYVPNYHSDTRKKRVDDDWWNQTLQPYLPSQSAQEKEEDEDISRQLSDKPLPSTINEYKNHPLYVLKRHLLKFEALYPPDAPTLGFVRGEPVYARECVVQLHSREMWYKQARLVRLKEEPYKIVKARPKFDKMTGEMKKDLPLELFGRWQTEDYIPPIATDGKVPRNEYGNVDLFQPCMLPIGTVHLQIPNLNKVAKKLGIDCAQATVGFDFHSGASHPVFDGYVVCEEFKTILLDSWNKEMDETVKRNEEKKEKRVYGNWRRLIRGLFIREKLKLKYAFGENDSNPSTSTDFQEKTV